MNRTRIELNSFKVAAVQFNPILGDVENNRCRMADLLIEAAEQDAKLIVFPEMASSGYVWDDRKEISPYVETIPGPTTDAISSITQKYQCYAAIGLPEVDPRNGVYYNSAVLIGPEGVVGSYRKTHLFSVDPRWAREGNDSIPVFETKIGRIALLICMDAMYFEPSRIAALQGADIIAFSTNWVGSSTNPPSKTWCLRAKENGLFWIASNRSNTERGAQFTGGSAIINPNGEVEQCLVSGEGIVYGKVSLDRHARQMLLETRRTNVYQELLLQPYLWKEGQTRTINGPMSYEIVVCALRHTEWKLPFFQELQSSLSLAESKLSTSNRLFVLPELEVLDGSDSIEEIAGDGIKQLQELSVRFNGYIIAALRNSLKTIAILVGPEGTIGSYEQVHGDLDDFEISNCAVGFHTVELPFGRVGLLTDMDAELPESYRILAKQGADIIAISGTSEIQGNLWMKRIWAFENDAVLAYAKPSQSEGLLFLHRQVNLESSSGSEWIIQRFEPDMTAAARHRDFMKRSKTHLYDLLV